MGEWQGRRVVAGIISFMFVFVVVMVGGRQAEGGRRDNLERISDLWFN